VNSKWVRQVLLVGDVISRPVGGTRLIVAESGFVVSLLAFALCVVSPRACPQDSAPWVSASLAELLQRHSEPLAKAPAKAALYSRFALQLVFFCSVAG
jgi:hypothetical protein